MNIKKKEQEIFEHKIELLIMYKQSHLNEEVYLNEECLNKAIYWINNFKNNISNIK
jgi:hypothetical protein